MSTAAAPPAGRQSMDFGRAFTFAFQDADWIKKLLIGGGFTLLSALIIGAFFVAGYWARLVKRVIAGEARPLPEWDDLGGIFGDGVRIVGLGLVCGLAIGIVAAGLGCVIALFVGGVGALADRSRGAQEAVGVLGGLGFVGLYALVLLAGLLLTLYFPAACVRMIVRDSFSEGFAFAANFAFIRANLGNYLLSVVAYIVANFVSQFGVILCCVGVFATTFWSYLVLAHAIGETVRLNPGSI
jgi:hypothetical protein